MRTPRYSPSPAPAHCYLIHFQAISKTALGYTVPIQARLAPVIVKADTYANAAVDAVESRYPYPFKVTTNEVVQDLKDRSDAAKGVASKTIDQRVTTPAYTVAAGIDQVRFTNSQTLS